MKRLIAFGCSHTYGESLPDCIDHTPEIVPPPSKFAWPMVLAGLLNLNCSNMAQCGISNRQISYHILNTDFGKNDLVIILWTGLYRSCIIGEPLENEIGKLHPSYAEPEYKNSPQFSRKRYAFNYNYYKQFYSKDNLIHESLQCIDHTKKYLDSRNITNYHFTFKRTVGHSPIESIWPKNLPGWFDVKENIIDFIDDYGSDNHHPGVQAQEHIAEQMFDIIDY